MTKYKNQIKKIFDSTKVVSCPAFSHEKIYFNAKGINHLIYKGNRSRREKTRIETNIRLLPSAIKVLKIMPLTQEESSYTHEGTIYKFWTFEAVINNRRIKVIVRQIGHGQKHFWSVIPAWRKDCYGILNAKKEKLKIKKTGRRLGISRINLAVNQPPNIIKNHPKSQSQNRLQ